MKLHFGNLSKTVTEAELRTLVVAIAEPASLEIVKDNAGTSRGYGYVEFSEDDPARKVMAGLDGKEVSGQVIKVGEARPRKTDKPKSTPSAPSA